MDTADVLRRKRAKLAGQIEFIDELLAEMGAVEDAPAVGPKVVRPPAPVSPAKPRQVEGEGTPDPKVVRPGDPAKPSARRAGAAEVGRMLQALLAGPQKLADLCAAVDLSAPTVTRLLRENPALFLRTGESAATRWELTAQGRVEATAR